MRLGLIVLFLLLCACAPRPTFQATEEGRTEARVRYATAEVPRDGGWGRLPGERLEGAHPVTVGPEALIYYRQLQKLYLVNKGKPELVVDELNRVGMIERLDQDHLLVVTDIVFVLELSTGKMAKLPIARKRELASLDGDKVYYFQDGLVQELAGPLSSRKFDRLLDEDRDAFYAVAGQDVYRVHKAGGDEKIGSCPVPALSFPALSPSRTKLALGQENGLLQVFDLKTGRMLGELKGLPVAVSKLSGRVPLVQPGWMDEHTVRFSISERSSERDPEFYSDRSRETPEGYFRWQDLDLDTGRVYDRGRYSRLALQHHIPFPEAIREERHFLPEEIKLWLPKSRVVHAAISNDGKRAAVLVRSNARARNRLLELDEAGRPTEIVEGQKISGVAFLPAVGQAEWCPFTETGGSESHVFPERTLRFFPPTWE